MSSVPTVSGRRAMPPGMTMIELLVVVLIIAIAISIGALALGAVSGAETREGAGKLATAVRYAYHLAAINNKTYALFLNLDENTYHIAPIERSGECDRVLLHTDGKTKDEENVFVSRLEDGSERKKAERKEAGKDAPVDAFGGVAANEDDGKSSEDDLPPSIVTEDTGPGGEVLRMMGQTGRALSRQEMGKYGFETPDDPEDSGSKTAPRHLKSFRKNVIGAPVKLPKSVKFGGVVLKDGMEPVTTGTVPLVIYPHGYVQRALIYIDGGTGDKDALEQFTVETLTLQARAVVHDKRLEPRDFKEKIE